MKGVRVPMMPIILLSSLKDCMTHSPIFVWREWLMEHLNFYFGTLLILLLVQSSTRLNFRKNFKNARYRRPWRRHQS